jgi:methionyl-tRNA synthetase
VHSLAIAIHSFLPKASQQIWLQVGMDGNISDTNWNQMSEISLKPGHKIGKVEPLFAKIESSVIDEQKAKLGD